MIISSETWLMLAEKIMPRDREDWLIAMRTELDQIGAPSDRKAFALGCFRAALLESAQSRKGLSLIARVGAASLLFTGSIAIWVLWTAKVNTHTDALAISKIFMPLCFVYMCGAALILTSLKGLKLYAAMGFSLAGLNAIYCLIIRPDYLNLPSDFLTALSFEVAGIMAGLFFFAVYLTWLYNPDIHEA